MVRQSLVRGLRLRSFAAVLVVPLGVSVVGSPVVSAKPAVVQVVSQAPDEASASAAARRQGSRVEVTGRTSETTRAFAEADGSFTAEQSVMPERVRRGDGWVNVDTTLEVRADGSVGPKATVSDVVFSGGGTAPLARLTPGEATMALSWRGVLPKPVLSGDSAVYPEVLPGVDLRVRATLLGFGHELVVKTAAAAANPALRKISFDLATTGATVTVDEHGNSKAVDAGGKVLLHASPPWMRETPAVQARGPVPLADKSAAVGLEVAGNELSLVPDKAMLADPNVGFPLVIDPDWSETTSFQSGWALVRKALPNSARFNTAALDEDERVFGVVRVGHPRDWGSEWVDRSIFRFDTTWVGGARIDHARIQLFQLWKDSNSCNPNDVGLMGVYKTGAIGPGTTWNNQPVWGAEPIDQVRSVAKLGSGCPPNWESLTATSAVQEAADVYAPEVNLGIRAMDEVDPGGWKRFENALKNNQPFFPKLWMKYNHPPFAPTDVSTDPPLPVPCFHCAGVSYVNNDRITLRARVTDPNGGQVTARWQISGQPFGWEQTLASGSMFGTSLDLAGRNGSTVTWTVKGFDGFLDGPIVDGPKFAVDTVGPDKPPGVAGDLYPSDGLWHGGPGVPGTFRFTPNGVTDVDRYRYRFTGGEWAEVNATALGGPGSVIAAPPVDGPLALFVQSVDRAGRASETTTHDIKVRPGNGPKANWPLDGNAKDEALMGERDGTVVGDVTWTPGASGAAARFTAAGGHITAPNTVRTDEGFSVAAWVSLDRADDKSYTVVSQDGTKTCGFCLTYQGDTKSWAFVIPTGDAETPQSPPTVVRAPAQHHAGKWTHLVGVYDRAENRVRLYVNGSYVAEAARQSMWNATGLLRIGQQMGGTKNQFEGAIDDLRLYDRVLTGEAVRALVGKDEIQAAHWRFDEESGTTAANAVEGGDAAVLRGGAVFSSDGHTNNAVKLSVSGDHVTSSGPVVSTGESFSVATWVKIDTAPPASGFATALSAQGNEVSAFFLGYRPVDGGKWEMYATEKDSSVRGPDYVVRSAEQAVLGRWTHLAVVFDKPTQTMKLYVDGALSATTARPKGFSANGPLIAGHGKWNGVDGANQWIGSVDEVRVYSRTLDNAEIQGVFTREAVAVGSWKLDGELTDDSVSAMHGTAVNGPTWVDGQSVHPDATDKAMWFDGVDDYVKTGVALDTRASFTVAAWVKPEQTTTVAGVVSQSGTNASSAFTLGFDSGKRWLFAMNGPGGANEETRVLSDAVARPGVWTHVAGAYDKARNEIRLYVNGLLVSTGTFRLGWNAMGELNIGRAKSAGSWRYMPGAVDDVKLHDRPLFQDEISQLAGRDLTLVHNLRLDEQAGSATAVDSAGNLVATVTGNAAFVAGRQGNAAQFNSADAQIATSGVNLRTDQSFTVSAWVKLTTQGGQLTAVSVDGLRNSKFRLGHVKKPLSRGSWVFEIPEADDDVNRVTTAAVSTLSSEVDTWVHLTGVYDAPARKTWLYVNGYRVGDGVVNSPWQASGGLVLGRGKLAGASAQAWPGAVDDVRLYTGRLDQSRVESLYSSYPAPAN